ncbi:glycine/betaine ABC transporter substrate-binding protein [Alicyclobacillus fastidiosus]|uniref:Glycine/betaine ABC transporter substrate-binding protein n=1 Tax=Alicyclobacillus fastidiosus TaxID=392011 RepID=A0ABY6ZKR9_9BACL|nr:glycine betaine ABC transporter substrate-binding protein [Alicyclobacillus fastidiosus]WAH42786.1 glycine/betaine ABC transporter substrate-binding protein [Alicyclobacillus fastidiosus]GMA64705.1 glycine/betaine ABC transporter substrate-binding protein [Alicyclobacillus fastidiosus]
MSWKQGMRKFWTKKTGKVAVTALSVGALITPVAGCGTAGAASSNTVVIGGKNFTEQDIMADMMADLIQKDTNLKVVKKRWLDSNVLWNAEKNGDVDIYVEYTGTGLVNILKDPVTTDPNKAYQTVKQQFEQKYHITWLNPIGFNNTYAMAMTQSEAKKLGVTTISQMAAKSKSLVLGTEQDFITRSDGLPAMNKLYGTQFKSVKSMEIGLKYKALVSGDVDVIDAFSTDGNIPANHLVLLKDDKHVFPPYYACPIIRDSVLKAHPELKTVLNKLSGKITDEEMQKLNEQVDLEHKSADVVAKTWLQQNGLL